MIELEHYNIAVRDCIELPIKGGRILLKEDPARVLEICNGVGPESFPSSLRSMIDLTHPYMITASIIHDLRYYYGDGTKFYFFDSNLDFMDNTIVVADNMYGRINPMRYLARRRASQFRDLLDRFGWDAYVAAIMERKNGQH